MDIPANGVVLESGWSITPYATSEVRLYLYTFWFAIIILFTFLILMQLTDERTQHSSERVACFALHVKWNKPEEHPVELRHRIKLLGAKPPGNFITLKIEPPSQPSLGMSSWYPIVGRS